MTDEERVGQLKRIAQNVRGNGCQTTLMPIESIEFLVERAERAQELEVSYEGLRALLNVDGRVGLQAEIKGLREALESIKQDSYDVIAVEVASEALELRHDA